MLRSTIGIAAAAGVTLLAPGQAWADCLVGVVTVQCDNTVTTDTTFPANPPVDRLYQGLLPSPIIVTVDPGTTVSGNGLAFVNTGTGGVTVTNNGVITVDAGNTPTAGGTAALSVSAAGGPITYTGGSIINLGNGNGFDAVQTGGVGSVNINVSSGIVAAAGEGITVRDVATSTGISVTTDSVTALTAGKDAIDAQSQSLTGNITEVANGNLQAGNAGMVAAILQGTATGNINVTANGSIDARFGIDAENFGSGSTGVNTVGPVNVTTGNGIFALSTGGDVTVNAGDVTSTGNTAIIAEQTKVAGTGSVIVGTTGNVSGTTGIDAHNFGTGLVGVVAGGTVTGTSGEGIKATGNAGVTVTAFDTVTGATRGLSLIGGTGGAGDILVNGPGGFVGGTGDAANILNNGSGSVTVSIAGASSSAGGEGIFVRDTAVGGDISVTTGAVTALTAGKDTIDVQTQSLTANITEVANGDLNAGNAGMVAAILQGTATGNIDVTANGSITARFGIDAENFGSGSTSVTTFGPVNVTTGNGIFALSTGGDVIVNAGDVTALSNTAIIAEQTKIAGNGVVAVTAGNVSGTTGIDAHNFGTGDIGIVANGTVTGTAAEGIKAIGNGGVSVLVADTVTGATRGLSLVGGTGGTGNISVTGTGGFVGGTGDAANILNNGAGTTTVNIAGASSSAGGEGIFVRDTAIGGNISVTTGAVTALTAGKDTIDVQSQSLTANITEVANGNLQAGNAAMVAAILQGTATGNIDVTANGSIDARFGIDAENFGSGYTSVTTVGPVNVTTGNGIFALSTGGNVFVAAGDVTSSGNTAIIAQQTKVAGNGVINLTAGNVSGTTGIDAHNFGTGQLGIQANGTVTGTAAEGIKATGNAGVAVIAYQTVTGATRGLSLVGGTGGAGDISVSGPGGFVGGTGDAANILNNGSGTVTVDISGASSSAGGEGFIVRDTAAGGDISVTTGAVTALTAGKDAIDVQSQSLTANITEVANGNIQAGNAGMVAAILNAAATGNIDVTANGSMDARFGVDAENFGSGSTSVTTVGPVNVTTGNGIFALTTGGNVFVNAGDVTSTSNTAIIAQQTKVAGNGVINVTTGNVSGTTGIDAHNFGTGQLGIQANGTVTGTAAEGIKATGNAGVAVIAYQTVTGATRGLSLVGGTGGAGDISVTGPGGFVGGTDDAANILNNGSGTVTVDISGASSSAGGNGFVVRDSGISGNISVTTGAVTALTAGKNAVDVQTSSLFANTVTEVANGDIQAGNAGMVAAILNAASGGQISVTANGSITARFGIDAENFGTGSTAVVTVGPVNATSGNGIFALSTGSDVVVNAGAVTSTGNTAIIAQQTKVAGNGVVAVTAGNVSGTTGIIATNFGTGFIAINTNGTVTGTAAEGIKATGNAGVFMTVAGTVTGATRGLSLVGGTGGAGNISVTGAGGFVGGTDDAANILNNGSGTTTVNISGASSSAGGNGFHVRDTASGGDISVTTGAVTALTAGKNAIDVITQSATANVTEVANGNIQAGNAGMVAAIIPAAATGNVEVTANGAITARFGVDAENFGSGHTYVTTYGAVNATSGNGIFALTTGGDVFISATDVTSTGNTAIIAQQTNAAGGGGVFVNARNVSGTTGIDARNFGTFDISTLTIGTVTGTAAEGIKAIGNAGVYVAAANTVTGATRGLSLIGGTGGTGDVWVHGTGGFVGGTGDAANILNNGTGTTTVNMSGASSSAGGNGFVVRDTALGGNISVTTGAVTALTAGKNGVDVITQSATANVTEVANGNIRAGNAGMVAAIIPAAATGNVEVTANGAITARFGVDAENFGSGHTYVTTYGAVNATSGNGIFALTTGGDVFISATDVTSTGNTAIIAQQTNAAGGGGVFVNARNVSGTTGIDARNLGTFDISTLTVGTVTGTVAEGIKAVGNAGVYVAAANTVTGATRGLSLIGGTGGTGDVWVHGTGGFVGGTDDAANILNNGAGTTTVNISGASSSTAGNGIVIADTAVGGGMSVTTGAVTALGAGKNAVYAVSASLTGNVAVVANGSIRANNAGLVAAILPATATGNVTVTSNGSVDARFGIDAENDGLGTTNVTTVGPVTATTGFGVYAMAHGGDVSVTSGSVTSTGGTAIYAVQGAAAGAGAVSVSANGPTGGVSGIVAQNLGTGTTTVTSVGPVTATTGNGIFALSTGGNVKVVAGSVSSTGASGIVAQDAAVGANTGKIDVTLTAGSTVIANAAAGAGIWTNSGHSSGTTTIIVNGTIHAGLVGISSTSTTGNIITNISATGAIDPLIGIDQTTVSGAISVGNSGLLQGDTIGVRLTSTGAGAVGALTLGQTGTGRISSILGVDLASVDAALIVSNAGQITGTGAAIRMTGTGTAAGSILNSGTITGSTTAVIATLNNTSFTLNNVGTLNGALVVSGSNVATSTVTNAGGAAMNFGSGTSSVSGNFINAGSASIGAGGSVLFVGNTNNSNRITFVGAGFFATNGAMTNTGIISAQNNITSNVVSVGGNYSGGGQFFADYSTATATADRLNIGGTASGNTNVTMNLVGPRAFVAGGFLPVVTVTPGAAATAFTSNTVFPTTGFVLEHFGQSPANNRQFGLIQQINPESASLGSLSYVAEAASATLDDPISPYLSERANPSAGQKTFSLWMRGAGGHTRETIDSTITGGGVVATGSSEVRTDHMALTMGADLGLLNLGGGGWNVHVGVLGGWYNGRADLSSAEQLRVETPFLGGYVAVGNGAFQLDGTLRSEWRHYKVVLPVLFSTGAPQKLNGSATAGSVHASYRFGGKTGFGATPFLGFNYADSSIDSLPIDAISAYIPGGDKTEMGEGGLRVSYRAGSDAKVVIEPFASASYLKNWSRGDSAVFSFGAPVTNFTLATTTWDNAMRYSVGVTAKARDGRVSGFLVGNINDGTGLHSFSLNAGVRFNF